jgi:phage shock protein E
MLWAISRVAAPNFAAMRVSRLDPGALSFPDIAVETLKGMIPDKTTRILIYCNNNFRDAEGPFPTKLPSASLNLSTYIALYNYGYRNVYELGPLVDIKTSRLDFETSSSNKQ